MPREWSARIRIARVVFWSASYVRPESSSASSMSGRKRSVSKTESASCWMSAIRSRPRPVSMFWFGRSVIEPSSWSSFAMKTRFQYSR